MAAGGQRLKRGNTVGRRGLHNIGIAVIGAAVAAASLPCAHAQTAVTTVAGPYVNLGLGGSVLNRTKINDYALPAIGSDFPNGSAGSIGTNANAIGSAAIGWGFGQGLRAELQGDYRTNQLSRFGGLPTSGALQQAGGFVNAFWDFDSIGAALAPGLAPYVGIGAGYEYVHFANAAARGDDGLGNTVLLRSTGSNGGFAAQAMIGLAYDIASIPGLAVTAEYRFTAVPEHLNYQGQFFAPDLATRATFRTDNLYNQAGLIGLRYALLGSVSDPVSETAPALPAFDQRSEARTYLVFFDWDRADLSPRARQIVAEAATASARVATTRIEVNGYTDLSGTTAYNKKLSLRRAQSVQAALVSDGVAETAITIQGLGESNPLVPTASGVREPQNRRVEIILK